MRGGASGDTPYDRKDLGDPTLNGGSGRDTCDVAGADTAISSGVVIQPGPGADARLPALDVVVR